ncbi:MAG: hypothetical protein MK095_08390, partial [Phycisphaerales bacterium]|nr:hypothetical protein [Phycisphaerales bacterium]
MCAWSRYRLRVQRSVDELLGDWMGWSRAPLGHEPVLVDPTACWCARCGASMPDAAAATGIDGSGCNRCRRGQVPFDGVVRLGIWEGELRQLVLGLKYAAWWEVAEPLGKLLAMRMWPLLGRNRQPAFVVPMPMPLLRRWSRGLDHAALLAASMGAGLSLPVHSIL